jgi:hypothetical protein
MPRVDHETAEHLRTAVGFVRGVDEVQAGKLASEQLLSAYITAAADEATAAGQLIGALSDIAWLLARQLAGESGTVGEVLDQLADFFEL